MFTHKPQEYNELGVKVKGEGKDFELAECAMRRRVSAKARGDAQERTVLGVAEAETLPFPQKERENARKRRGFEEKSTSFFSVCSYEQKIRNIFSEKRLYFEIKDLSLPLIKHNHPFFRRNAASI